MKTFHHCYLQGMSLVPAVTELLLAELMYLQYDNPTKPIFMYINSAGVQVSTPHLLHRVFRRSTPDKDRDKGIDLAFNYRREYPELKVLCDHGFSLAT